MVRSINRRASLLLGGAGLAMAAALALPAPAQADAFNGTPVFVRGSGNVDRSVSNVDTITITSSSAVLDWTIYEDNFGNALTFLPNGNTAYFQDGPGQGGFAVLNRILPSTNGNVVVFQGSVISRLQDGSGNFSNGGMVAFYSPTGIIVGANAVFDVGQLLLTTLDPDLDSFDSYAAGGTLLLAGASGATAGVTISSGAQIGAPGEGSYFAVAAPQIAMRGNAYINGSSAYIVGEQVNLSYANGLFNIQIPVGTSVASPFDHNGTTGGPSSTGSGDNHLIYAVAKAATDPITMLLRGNLGFDPAATAGIDNGDIILSAGYDVFGRSVSTGAVDSNALDETILLLGSSNFSSSVFAGATGSFRVNSDDGAIDFADGLIAHAARSIALTAGSGNDLTIAGEVELHSQGTILGTGDVVGGTINLLARNGSTLAIGGGLFADATPTQNNGDTTGGQVYLDANGGTLSIDGDVWLRAEGNDFFGTGTLGDSFGGTTRLLARNAGTISLGSTLRMDTQAFGNGLAGRRGIGGTSEIIAQSGGIINVLGAATLRASGFGGDADGSLGVFDGGLGMGGRVQLLASGGTLNFGSDVLLSAEGIGGEGAAAFGLGSGTDFGGVGTGGFANIQSNGGSLTIAGQSNLFVRGFGGQGASGGDASGGNAQVFALGTGTIELAGVSGAAHGLAGGGLGASGRGGDAQGGVSLIETIDTGVIHLTGDANMQANAFGGDGHTGGDATGGNAGVYAIYGSIAVDGSAYLSAQAFGGDATVGFGGNGGNALGGTSYVQADGSQTQSASLTIGGNASAYAGGYGGTGGAGDGGSIAAGEGGDGTGGTYQGAPGTGGAFALAGRDNATLTIGGFTTLDSGGIGGTGGVGGTGQAGGRGGDGTGGTTQAGTFSGRGDGSLRNGQASFHSLSLSANGLGGQGGTGGTGLGAGGDGTGGFAGTFAVQSRVDAADVSTVADGRGGYGSTGGLGTGGQAGIGVVSGTLSASSLYGSTTGTGGDATTGDGGDGIGGEISIDTDGTLNVTGDSRLNALGLGGTSSAGFGGFGTGGVARFTSTGSATSMVGGTLSLSSYAVGGSGSHGGGAQGGTAQVDLGGVSALTAGSLYGDAGGRGGDGAVAGAATGGEGSILVGTGGSLVVERESFWQAGATGGSGINGDGADAQGGAITVESRGGTIAFNELLYMQAQGIGGGVINGAGRGGSGRGGAIGISASGGGSLSFWSIQASAGGLGGTGPTAGGGDGFGGVVAVTAIDSGSRVEVLNERSLRHIDTINRGGMFAANGIGGNANGGSGIGGLGTGGDVFIVAGAGSTIALPSTVDPTNPDSIGYTSLVARGYGGGSAVDGGRGGDGVSGTIEVLANGGTFTSGDMLASVFAQGGNSLNGALDISGGNAFGGTRIFSATNGGSMTVSMIGGGSGAVGGNGSGSGIGGDATGGSAFLLVDNADVTFVGRGLFFAGATGGSGRIGGDAVGGNIYVVLSNGANVDVVPSSDGTALIGLGDPVFGGDGIEQGGSATGDNVIIQVQDSTLNAQLFVNAYARGGTSAQGIGGDAFGGTLTLQADNSQVSLVSGSLFDVSAFGGDGVIGGSATGGAALVRAINGSVVDIYGDPTGVSNLTIDSNATGGTGTEADGDAQGGSINLAVIGSTLSAPELALNATAFSGTGTARGGDLAFRTSAAGTSSIGSLQLDASATTGATAQAVGGSASLVVDSAGSLSIGNARLEADGDDFGGLIGLDASGGTMQISSLAASAFGAQGGADAFVRTSGGSILINDAAVFDISGDLTFSSADGGIFGGPTVNAPTAQIYVTSQGTVRFVGDNDGHIGFGGREVFIRSRDLDILSGARIGAEYLGLSVVGNSGTTILGGNSEGAGYTLTQAELERIEAGAAYFASSFDGMASDDILIRDMTIAGSLDDGTSSVFIEAGGVVRVEGVLSYVDAAATDRLGIYAQRLEIVTPGGIGIVGPQGNPTGIFSFYGGDFWMADANTIDRLRENSAFEGRDELLATAAAGSADPLGYLRAGDIFLTIGDSLLVRNTGTSANPGGITVTGGLTIGGGYYDENSQDPQSTPLDVVAYGRKLNADGTFVTGEDFFKLIEFNTEEQDDNFVTTYAEGSQFNDCNINSGACAATEMPEPPDEREEVLDEVEEEAPAAAVTTTEPIAAAPVEQSEQDSNVEFGSDFPALLSASLVVQADSIDDPVTSGGDIALYGAGEEDPGEDDEEEGDQ
ncbi:beta strand repeat-containing protein [Qipengyuania sp.]|uniref:beta strand repeat-containing protein n=1 Tax=Qipengyuania sp. TaxID=2004515 RepID=UPI003AF8E617